jgi:GntR family transcriptional repressor for pyruvate dehydrogenase complex
MFEQVQNKKYYMQIVSQIRSRILDGDLKTGDKLPPERVLAQEFGTSRASIREALSALEMLGLVESKSGYGNFIKTDGNETSIDGELFKGLLKEHSPYEIFESRLELEPTLAALAAKRATTDEKNKLKDALSKLAHLTKKMSQGTEKLHDNIEAYMEEDRKLHLLIGRTAHNSVLFTVFSGVNLMMNEIQWKTLKTKSICKPGNLISYHKLHEGIVEAICNVDSKAARKHMRKHILDLKEDMFEE